MKTGKIVKSATATVVTAGMLCAALLAGCGQAGTTSAPEDRSAQNPVTIESPTNTPITSDVMDYLAPASAYTKLSSFTAKTIDGKTFTQKDLAKADVTVINFWATYCGYCVDELPQIASWAKEQPDNVRVITVCTDYDSDPVGAQEILNDAGFTGTTLVAADGDLDELLFDVTSLPTTIVVDKSGNIATGVLEGAAGDVPATFGALVNSALSAQGKKPANG